MRRQAKTLAVTAMFTALTIIATVFLKIPLSIGYIHAGDIVIFTACYFLRPKYAVVSAGVGSMLADLMVGYVVYMPASLIIKGVMALIAGSIMYKDTRLIKMFLGFTLAGLFMILGYFVFEGFFYGWAMAVANLLPSLIQPVVGITASILLIFSLKKIRYVASFRETLKDK